MMADAATSKKPTAKRKPRAKAKPKTECKANHRVFNFSFENENRSSCDECKKVWAFRNELWVEANG